MVKIAIIGYGDEAQFLTVLGYPFQVLSDKDLLKDAPFESFDLLIFPSRMFFYMNQYGINISKILRLEINKVSSFVEKGNIMIAFPGRVLRSDFMYHREPEREPDIKRESFLLPFDIRFKPTFRYMYSSTEVSPKSEFLRGIDSKEIFSEMAHVGYLEYVQEPYQTILRRKDGKPIFIEKKYGLGWVVLSSLNFRPLDLGRRVSLDFYRILINNALRKSNLPILSMRELDQMEAFSPSAFMEVCNCMRLLKRNNVVESAKAMRKSEEIFLKKFYHMSMNSVSRLTLFQTIKELRKNGYLKKDEEECFDSARKIGNLATHNTSPIQKEEVTRAFQEMVAKMQAIAERTK